MSKTTITYALRDKQTGELLRYEMQRNEGCDSVEVTVTLVLGSKDSSLPIYEQPTLRQAAIAIKESTPWYNAAFDTPRHARGVDPANIEVVRRELVETLVPQVFEHPLKLTEVCRADKPGILLRRYAGRQDLPEGVSRMSVLELPDGYTLEDLASKAKDALFSLYRGTYVLEAVFEVPEDYVGLLKGSLGFAAVVREATDEELEANRPLSRVAKAN